MRVLRVRETNDCFLEEKKNKQKKEREEYAQALKKTERVRLKHSRSKKEHDLSTYDLTG
tara:strand:- start:230 stop:406 length:177 start_codon:yes stop_codon:yes gene_type:complete